MEALRFGPRPRDTLAGNAQTQQVRHFSWAINVDAWTQDRSAARDFVQVFLSG
jgi:hypothetical protein